MQAADRQRFLWHSRHARLVRAVDMQDNVRRRRLFLVAVTLPSRRRHLSVCWNALVRCVVTSSLVLPHFTRLHHRHGLRQSRPAGCPNCPAPRWVQTVWLYGSRRRSGAKQSQGHRWRIQSQ